MLTIAFKCGNIRVTKDEGRNKNEKNERNNRRMENHRRI